MSEPRGPRPDAKRPAEVMRASEFRQRFIEHTLAQRDDESGRSVLAAEWRYIGPLLAERRGGARDVLDLACGSGHQTLAWAERGFSVTGLDFDHDLLVAGRHRIERARTAPDAAPGPAGEPLAGEPRAGSALSARWTCADATRLPFRDGAFDVVFNNSLLEHVPDWRLVLAETARVLRPGGLFVMYTTNRTCPIQQEVNHFPFYPWLPDPIQRRVLAWIMKHRRDLVNFTDFPAVNWFTFPGMRRAFRAVGLDAYDRIDLMARHGARGVRRAAVAVLSRSAALKWPYYLYAISMALYGVRRSSGAEKT